MELHLINALAELDRVGLGYQFKGEDEVSFLCPFHNDNSPSCFLNVKSNLFKCHAAICEFEGDVVTLLAKILKTTRYVMLEDLSVRYDLANVKSIEPKTIEKYHNAIWTAAPFLKELYKRGVTDDLIRKYRIGYNRGRVTIPISNENGLWVNVRRYMPGAPGPDKFRNEKGFSRNRLYPYEQLEYQEIVICGGEMKAIVAANALNEFHIGAISATGGEGNWEIEWNKLFKGKDIYVCFDIDKAGKTAAEKLCRILCKSVNTIKRITLPIGEDEFSHGDINDWFGLRGATGLEFQHLIEKTPEWLPKIVEKLEDNEPIPLTLVQSTASVYTARRVKVTATVCAVHENPYIIPKRVAVTCDRNQKGLCQVCPIFQMEADENGIVTQLINPESSAILGMVDCETKALRNQIIDSLQIPPCKNVTFKALEHYNVEDLRITPQLQITSRQSESLMLPALYTGQGIQLNESYEIVGRMFAHPKTQQATLLISDVNPIKDALSTWSPNDESLKELEIFSPDVWGLEDLECKLNDIYEDFASNVTHIYHRRSLHLAIDLAYHSALIYERELQIHNMWTQILVLGDSAQGKSEATMRLMRHYGLGEKLECKNASVAGVLGGVQRIGGDKWFVTWGTIPTHDRGLVVLEELKGASTEVIAQLTDMRSSGVAEIRKIEKRRTHARTRLLALSNPRGASQMSAYNFGVDAVKELIGGLEDVRRFDFVLICSAREVTAEQINQTRKARKYVDHIFTDDLCKRCILWGWTRRHDQIIIDDDVWELILEKSKFLCSQFSDAIPIVDHGTMRWKLTKLAVALAVRTFSHSDDLHSVIVRLCHVEYIANFIYDTYKSTTFGYLDFSNASKIMGRLNDPKEIETKLEQTPFPHDFISHVLHTTEIELRDICDWCGWDRENGIELLSFLVRKNALKRDKNVYRKTPDFIELLKSTKVGDRPSHITEVESEF